ncbi:MAG TPA: hypothetical protein VH815_02665 [Acidobacteriota bacterium]
MRPMLKVLIFACVVLLGCKGKTSTDYVGLWQFETNWVWIKILPDGRCFQCRVARSGKVFRSEGLLKNGEIKWQDNWPIDKVTRSDSELTISGDYGTFSFHPAQKQMVESCEAPF